MVTYFHHTLGEKKCIFCFRTSQFGFWAAILFFPLHQCLIVFIEAVGNQKVGELFYSEVGNDFVEEWDLYSLGTALVASPKVSEVRLLLIFFLLWSNYVEFLLLNLTISCFCSATRNSLSFQTKAPSSVLHPTFQVYQVFTAPYLLVEPLSPVLGTFFCLFLFSSIPLVLPTVSHFFSFLRPLFSLTRCLLDTTSTLPSLSKLNRNSLTSSGLPWESLKAEKTSWYVLVTLCFSSRKVLNASCFSLNS